MSEDAATALTPADWWNAAAESRLLLLRCPACDAHWLPWMPHCPDCGPGTGPVVVESSGRGSLYSWVVVHKSLSSPSEVPFTVASVRLVEGAMIYGRLSTDGTEPRANAVVNATFQKRDGMTVIDFTPESSGGASV
jgi:uncharacterized OB-fold protein